MKNIIIEPIKIKLGDPIQLNQIYYSGKRYIVHIKEISRRDQRILDPEIGECKCPLFRVDIYNREFILLASDSIITYDSIIKGNLKWYIPNLDYDTSYMGRASRDDNPKAWMMWKDMIRACYNPGCSTFPYIGALGTIVCDRWLCFEYFLADLPHIQGYTDEYLYDHMPYIIDLYDRQRNIEPWKRIYAPGYVKMKKFPDSDISKYSNSLKNGEYYPHNDYATHKYTSGQVPQYNLFYRRSGLNFEIDTSIVTYYPVKPTANNPIRYGLIPYFSNSQYRCADTKYGRDMCTIIN